VPLVRYISKRAPKQSASRVIRIDVKGLRDGFVVSTVGAGSATALPALGIRLGQIVTGDRSIHYSKHQIGDCRTEC